MDVKGDLPNLLSSFPDFDPSRFVPWAEVDPSVGRLDAAVRLAEARRAALSKWSFGEEELRRFRDSTAVRVLTPGATTGEPLHVLSTLERRSPGWDTDPESARFVLSGAVSLLLRLLGRDPDPARSREHVLLSVLAERRMLRGQNAELSALMDDLADPPVAEIGALPIDSFFKKTERRRSVVSGAATDGRGPGAGETAWRLTTSRRRPISGARFRDWRCGGLWSGPVLMHPRETLSLMRGPMTRDEIQRAREQRAGLGD